MFLHERIYQINERLKVLENTLDIVIWGAGIHTCKLLELTDMLSYSITDIVDISKNKKGNPCFGFTIKNPEEITWDHVDAVVISVPGKEMQITDMLLEEWGFQGRIITLYEGNETTPFYLLYDEKGSSIQFLGDYDNWESAYRECAGYGDSNIVNTVIASVEKVLSGEAAWERDGFLFYEPKYNHSICASVLKCAVQNGNRSVRILDIGGSLGSTYFQNKDYLTDIDKLEWVVAEQDAFVQYGKQHLEDGSLRFISSSDRYVEYSSFDIVLMSGSIQYINEYAEIISKILEAKPRYIILDRIAIGDRRRICKEIVTEKIYKSSYPIRIFSENDITYFFSPDYKIVEKDTSSVNDKTLYFADGQADYRYYVLRLVEDERDEYEKKI